MKYFVIATVNDTEYLTKVEAESNCRAEHIILDKGICGRHEYGVKSCQAFDKEDMKYDNFRTLSLYSEPVRLEELFSIIEAKNDEIRTKDEAEDLIRKNEKLIEELQAQIAAARKVLGQ